LNFVRAFIFATTACQFNCTHCFVGEERKTLKPKHIDLKLVEQFLSDFGSEKYDGFKSINITGVGNPLLHPELPELISILREAAKEELSINCRGFIKDDLLLEFKYHNVVVYYSMDFWGERADREMRYDGLWREQVTTLRKMVNLKIPVAIRTTIMRDNIGDCLRFIGFVNKLRRMGANIEWHGMPYLPYHNPERMPTQKQMEYLTAVCLSTEGCRIMFPFWTCMYPDFRERARRWWTTAQRICEAGREFGRIALTQDGEVLPCPFETEVLGKYTYTNGRYKIDMVRFRAKLSDYLDMDMPKYCKGCSFADYCKGGCRIYQKLTDICICPKSLWGD
jgi:radical SAM protein with 4Fe4S-binding SPASM domain